MDANAKPQATDYNMVVAYNIRAELSRERWSHRKAANALGVTANWVNRRMSGETRLDPDDIMLFAEFLHVPVAELFTPKTRQSPASGETGLVKLLEKDSNLQPAGSELAQVTRLAPRMRGHERSSAGELLQFPAAR